MFVTPMNNRSHKAIANTSLIHTGSDEKYGRSDAVDDPVSVHTRQFSGAPVNRAISKEKPAGTPGEVREFMYEFLIGITAANCVQCASSKFFQLLALSVVN